MAATVNQMIIKAIAEEIPHVADVVIRQQLQNSIAKYGINFYDIEISLIAGWIAKDVEEGKISATYRM